MKPANDDPQAAVDALRRRGEELTAKLARATTAAEQAEVMAEFTALNAELQEHAASQKRLLEELKERNDANRAELRRRGIDPDAER